MARAQLGNNMPLHSSLPQIEGFQPIPNAVMIPFMEAQSAALAYGFGLNYEYGKRKIRSMSNEEYNSLTSEDITNMTNAHTHIILSQFQLQVPKVMPMQKEIFNQYVIIEKEKILQNVALLKWITANAPQILAEGETPGSSLKKDVSLEEFEESLNKINKPPITSSGTKGSTAHKDSHNGILQKYDEAKTIEESLIAYQAVITKILAIFPNGTPNSQSLKNQLSNAQNKIKSLSALLLKLMTLIGALQSNHQKSYGHQVTPYSAKV